MSATIGTESSALLKHWRKLSRSSSAKLATVSDSQNTRSTIGIDSQTSEWVLNFEFPMGGPKPKIISLDSIRVEESLTAAIPRRRVLSVRYDSLRSNCTELWPHFAEALVTAVVEQKQKTHCAQSIGRTFEAWRKFWPGKRKLGPEQIIGLFGELSYLKKLLRDLSPPVAIEAWHGPLARDHDFAHNRIALEVKTSAGLTNKVTIANLDQLDESGLDGLFLVHARLRTSDDKKLSLQALVDSIHAQLTDELKVKFTAKLGRVGWFKATQDQRDSVCFRSVESKLYRVVSGFPRILRSDLKQFGPGVDVKKYTVNLTHCVKFRLEESDEENLLRRLRESETGNQHGTISTPENQRDGTVQRRQTGTRFRRVR